MSPPYDLRDLTAGATGEPAYTEPDHAQAELRRQQRQLGWDEATPLVHDASTAYRDVVGPRDERQEHEAPGASRFL